MYAFTVDPVEPSRYWGVGTDYGSKFHLLTSSNRGERWVKYSFPSFNDNECGYPKSIVLSRDGKTLLVLMENGRLYRTKVDKGVPLGLTMIRDTDSTAVANSYLKIVAGGGNLSRFFMLNTNEVLVSNDSGDTWSSFFTSDKKLYDMLVPPKKDSIVIVSGESGVATISISTKEVSIINDGFEDGLTAVEWLSMSEKGILYCAQKSGSICRYNKYFAVGIDENAKIGMQKQGVSCVVHWVGNRLVISSNRILSGNVIVSLYTPAGRLIEKIKANASGKKELRIDTMKNISSGVLLYKIEVQNGGDLRGRLFLK